MRDLKKSTRNILEGNGSTTCGRDGNWSHDLNETSCKPGDMGVYKQFPYSVR